MSDVTVNNAPPPAPAPQPSVQGNEAVVNTNPTQPPSPISNRAPDRPEGQEAEKPQVSRKEAIANAFERAKEAQAKVGSEPKAKTTPKAGDDVEGQSTQDAKSQQQRYREGGRFARDPASNPAQDQNQNNQGQTAQQQPAKYQPLHETAPFRDPPPRFSEQAQADWHGAPESVRGAVHQMQREFAGAYQKYREAAQVIEPIRPFHEMAQQHGTTLEKALTNYVGMEQKLRSDLIGGLDVIVNNLGLKGQDGRPITLQDVAHHVLSMTPEQRRMTSQGNQTQAIDMRMGQLHQTVESLAQTVSQMQYQNHFQHTRSAIDVFADSHPRFDELSDLIKNELDHGYSLEDAYQRATLLRPGTAQAAQTRNTSAQTRPSKSISGAPDTGLSDRRSPKADGKHPTRQEALQRAYRRVNGAA